MRGLLIMVALLLVLGGAGFAVWRMNPGLLQPSTTAPPEQPAAAAQPERRRAEFCSAQDAIYAHRRDPSLTMRLVDGPDSIRAYGSSATSYGNLGGLFFVVRQGEQEFRFAAASSQGVTLNYLFPLRADNSITIPAGVDLIQVSTFDSAFVYTPGLPRLEYAAPAYIYAPNMTRYLYNNSSPRIEAPIDFFDFQSCESAAAPEAAQPAQ